MATLLGLFCASLACFFIVTVALINQVAINRSFTAERPVTTLAMPSSLVETSPIAKQVQFQHSRVTEPPPLAPVTLAAPVTSRKHPEPSKPSVTRQVEMFLDYCANEMLDGIASADAVDMYFDMCIEFNQIPHAKKTFLSALGKVVRKTQWRVDGERPRVYLLNERVVEHIAQAA